MEALMNLHKRFGCTLTVAVIYLVVHFFFLFSIDGPSFSDLQDTCSIQVMQTVKSISLTALTKEDSSVRASLHDSIISSLVTYVPFCTSSHTIFDNTLICPLSMWQIIIGKFRESLPSSDMVERK